MPPSLEVLEKEIWWYWRREGIVTCPCLQQVFLALPFLVLSAKEHILDHPCLGLRGQGLSLREPGRQEEQLGLCMVNSASQT